MQLKALSTDKTQILLKTSIYKRLLMQFIFTKR